MKIHRVIEGQYSEIKLDDGKKIFLSVLPDRITASTMTMFIPTKKIWEFIFPFYIRTSNEAWDSSKDILKITIDSISDSKNLEELKNNLKNLTSKLLREYVNTHGEKARDISVDKVGHLALKQMINPKDLNEIEKIVHDYGKFQVEIMQDVLTKYPAFVFPESLLPYSKKKIADAFNAAIQYTEDSEMVNNLKASLAYLECFIADDEANKRNSELLKNPDFMKAVQNKKANLK